MDRQTERICSALVTKSAVMVPEQDSRKETFPTFTNRWPPLENAHRWYRPGMRNNGPP